MNSDEIEEYLEGAEQLSVTADFLNDDEARFALSVIRKLIQKPDVTHVAAQKTIIQLQAIAAQSKMLAKYYQTIGKTEADASHHKNLYYSLSEELDKLVMALKKGV